MKRNKKIFIPLLPLAGAVLFLCSCATPEKMDDTPGPGPEKHRGPPSVTGHVIPVDSDGNELAMQEKDRILLTVTALGGGVNKHELHTDENGEFRLDFDPGSYLVKVTLEGFYATHFTVSLKEGLRRDVGAVALERIETGAGIPLKGGDEGEFTESGGDVNIQPPS